MAASEIKEVLKFSALFVMISKLIILSKQNGIRRTNPTEENCPPVGVRVWFRVRVSFKVGGQFSTGAIVLEPNRTCGFTKNPNFIFF